MKKLSFLFAALLVCGLVLSSCQSKPAEQATDSTPVEETVAPVDTAAPAAEADTTQQAM